MMALMTAASTVHPGRLARLALPAIAVAAVCGAVLILVSEAGNGSLDYATGVLPPFAPWLAALLTVAVVGVGLSERLLLTLTGLLLMVGLAAATALSVGLLPFDLLRIVGLIPLPLSLPGLGLRLLLLTGATAALIPALTIRRAHQARCASCRRPLPGRIDQVPRWPVAVALLFSLPYPVLRTIWALGGTFGTTGEPLELDPALAWGVTAVGWLLVTFVLVLLVGRGSQWLRALFGLAGVVAGVALTVNGGLAALLAFSLMASSPTQPAPPGVDLPPSTFLIVYGSWFIAGMGVVAGSWRYWARRRLDCAQCGPLLRA
jgi:hypothetical protein